MGSVVTFRMDAKGMRCVEELEEIHNSCVHNLKVNRTGVPLLFNIPDRGSLGSDSYCP